MIAPLATADIDIFVILDSKYYEKDGQAALLDKVKRALKATYKTPEISRNGQAVTITFTDFKVDVVPPSTAKGVATSFPQRTAASGFQPTLSSTLRSPAAPTPLTMVTWCL